MDLSDIQAGLAAKQIFLMPYCHADHAWCHSRDWHEKRYFAAFRKMLELFERLPEFRYFIDSWSELLKPSLECAPASVTLVKQRLDEGRLALVGGHWSNVRFAHVGDETSVRNMVYGKRAVRELFPEARLDAYANLDVAIGHSQVPQLVRLAGYDCYFAWRPQKGLDDQAVPRSFVWQGLSGHEVLVTRHSYGGWAHGIEFNPSEAVGNDTIDVEHAIRFAWERYLQIPASQPDLDTISFCQGGDDAVPLVDQGTGVERDIPGLIEEWNRRGLGHLSFGTPHDVFDALRQQRASLPRRAGILDPAELCYHIARNGRNGVWWLRDLCDRELVLAEQLATLASLQAVPYPDGELLAAWQDHLTFCTHAVEFLFDRDFDRASSTLERAIGRARRLQRAALAALTRPSNPHDPDSFVAYNPLPEPQTRCLTFELPNVDNSRRRPVLRDKNGAALTQQIIYAGRLARDFDVMAAVSLPACGMAEVHVDWSMDEVTDPEPQAQDGLDLETSFDRMTLQFREGRLVRVEDTAAGASLQTGESDIGLLDAVALPKEIDYWMPTSFADTPLPFIVEELRLDETGPLRQRVTRKGRSGGHHVIQNLDIYRGADTVDVTTTVDIVPDCAMFALALPLTEAAELTVDVPFGVEARDLSAIDYGCMGSGHYENIERRLPGIFWGRSWVFAQTGDASFGLITVDGPRYFRRHGPPPHLLHFLVSIPPDRDSGWQRKVNTSKALGRHVFHHQLVLSGGNHRQVDMVRRAQRLRTPIAITGGVARDLPQLLQVAPAAVRLSAIYREGAQLMVRVVNVGETPAAAELTLGFTPRAAQVCDFEGQPAEGDICLDGVVARLRMAPWQIATVRLTP